jgi:Tfp pilus assembly protein PilO
MKIDLNKILEIFNGLNEHVRYSIFGFFVLLVVLSDVFFLVLPQCGSIVDVNNQIKQLSQDTAQVLNDKQRIDQLKNNLEQTRLTLDAMNAKVRPLQEVPAILDAISRIANKYDVKIDQLIPQKQVQESLTQSEDGHYYALPIAIQARCGYHMFGRFLNKLENSDLYFSLKDLIIQDDEKDLQMHSFTLTIKIILVDKARI